MKKVKKTGHRQCTQSNGKSLHDLRQGDRKNPKQDINLPLCYLIIIYLYLVFFFQLVAVKKLFWWQHATTLTRTVQMISKIVQSEHFKHCLQYLGLTYIIMDGVILFIV